MLFIQWYKKCIVLLEVKVIEDMEDTCILLTKIRNDMDTVTEHTIFLKLKKKEVLCNVCQLREV